MTAAQRREVVPVAVKRASNAHAGMRAAALADAVFQKWWDEGVKDRLPRAEEWLEHEGVPIEQALLDDR